MRITALGLVGTPVLAGAIAPASAQTEQGARPAPERALVRDFTPAGAGIPDILASDFLQRVRTAVDETNRFVRIRQVPAVTGERGPASWQRQWCAVTEVVVKVQALKDGFAPYVALVGGRTHADVVRDLSSRDAAEAQSRIHREDSVSDGEFRLAYAWIDDRWVLRGALFRPEIRATPEIKQALPPSELQTLWTGGPDTREVDFCMVAALWRDL